MNEVVERTEKNTPIIQLQNNDPLPSALRHLQYKS